MGSLYELNSQLQELFELRDLLEDHPEEEVEIFKESWDALLVERQEKISNYCDLYKSWKALAEQCLDESKKLRARHDTLRHRAEALKKFLRLQLQERESFETGRHKINWRSSEALVVDNEDAVPERYWKMQQPHLDKLELKRTLKSLLPGQDVPGYAHIEKRVSLSIK